MRKIINSKALYPIAFILLLCLGFVFAAKKEPIGEMRQFAQDIETLELNREVTFALKTNAEKAFYLNLKKGDLAELFYTDSLNRYPEFSLLAPSGRDLMKEMYILQDAFPFVAPEDGKYRLNVKFYTDQDSGKEAKITIRYTNEFKLPKSAKLARQRKVGGYDFKVFNVEQEEEYGSFLLIEKNGKIQHLLKGDSVVVGGFNFADDDTLFDYPEGKRSARLIRATPDKTGDGTPDIALQYYTGGAHCCVNLHFFELGKNEVRKIKMIDGRDSDVLAIGKKPNGSLILKTGDSTFAYWLTSFAGSPIPTVILSFQNGEFRADAELMRKPAPSAAVLKRKAAEAKKHINLNPYKGEEDDGFTEAFWGEMLNLLYTGNETAAWQYFDMVWDARKPGKEKFKRDFLRRLNESDYWQSMREGGK